MSTAQVTGKGQGTPGRASRPRKRAGRPRIDSRVRAAIRQLCDSPKTSWVSPVDIHRLLKGRADCKDRVPSLRSVQREVSKCRPPETGWWSLADGDADPDDAALVLPVLAETIEASGERWQRFGKDLAGWIVKVRVAAPDIPPLWAFSIATAYRGQKDADSAAGLDQLLAFAPWRGRTEFHRYLRAAFMLHPDWFDHFEVAENGEPTFSLSYKPAVEGILIACMYYSPGGVS